MAEFRGEREAFGRPGDEPFWTDGNKEGIGTTRSFDSRTWFTIQHGVATDSAAQEFRELLEVVSGKFPDLTAKCADLQSHLDEVLRRLT